MGDRRAAIINYNAGVEQNRAFLEGKGDRNLAYQLHSSAVLNDSNFGLAWHELGNLVGDMEQSAAAIAAHRVALEFPDGAEVGDMSPAARAKSLVNLGHRLHVLGRNEEGMAYIQQALDMDSKIPQGWCCLSLCQSLAGDHDAAVASALTGLSLEPGNATIETALAINLLFRGDFKRGLKRFESRYRYKLKHFLTFPYPQWDGSEGKKVYLVADQGIGDTLSFARFLERAAAKCKFMYVGVQKELVRLLKASFQHIPNISIDPVAANGWPPAEFWTTFVSLPTVLDLSEEEIRGAPGIKIPQFEVGTQWKNHDRKHHIAVAWRGSTVSDIDHHRSFAVENLLRLYEIPGVQLYSLQIGDKAAELHSAGASALIRDLSPYVSDVADTMSVLRNVDLVVTVESALGHMAGAMNKPTIIPYSAWGHDYRIGRNGENIIWYPKHSIVKQNPNEPWVVTFGRVVDAVRERVRG